MRLLTFIISKHSNYFEVQYTFVFKFIIGKRITTHDEIKMTVNLVLIEGTIINAKH